MNRTLTLIALCLMFLLPSCLATTSDVDAGRENTRALIKKQTEETEKLVAGERTPAEFRAAMSQALGLADSDWDSRPPEGKGWLALVLGPVAAAAVYGARELQRRRDLKSVRETDAWVAEVEKKVDTVSPQWNPPPTPSKAVT